jgi:Acetyltransferase (GNAT) domain
VFSRNTRYKIRRAEKEGVEIEWDSSGQLVDVHYDLHLRWTDRRARERGLPISAARTLARRRESLAVDRAVASRFRERCRVGIAWLANEPVASMIVLRTGAHANWWRSANDRERMGRTYATWLLLAQALEEAAAFGCEHFHMGESGGVASLMEFKEHFGGERRHYQELRFESALAATTVRLRDHAGSRAVKLAAWTAGLRRGSRE